MKKGFSVLLIVSCLMVWLAPPVSAELSVSAKAAVLLCADTGEVLFEKNATQKLPMASTTKIMTAFLLAEQPDLSKTVFVTEEMVRVEGSSMGLLPGDSVSYRDLLYGMLLASGNDAANVTAIALGGSLSGFALLMNQKAKEIGLNNTSYVTPSGLDDKNHYTTAYDLALLTREALKNKAFRAACSSRSAVLYYGNPPYRRTLTNHNKLLGHFEGLIGVKTGYTKRSGRCLVTAADRDGKRVIAVTLHAPDDWNDHRTLLDFGLSKVETHTFDHSSFDKTLPIVSGDCDAVKLRADSAIFCAPKRMKGSIRQEMILPPFCYATLKAGEKVGEIRYYYGKQQIGTSAIYSTADVHLFNPKISFFNRFWQSIKKLWNS